MAVVGYARVSSTDQHLDIQLEKLTAKGAEKVYREKVSGVDRERPELAKCIDYLREGDTLLVTRVDRMGRSAAHLYQIVEQLNAKGVGFKAVEQDYIDTTSTNGRMVFQILAAVAEAERETIKERQREGIERAKASGVKFGPKPKLSSKDAVELAAKRAGGVKIVDLMAEYGLSKSSVYNALSAAKGVE